MTENGLIAGVFFLFFLIHILIKVKRDVYLWLFFSLTIIFFFDFSYRFNSFLFLWFTILGLINEEDRSFTLNLKFLLSIILLILEVIFLLQISLLKSQSDPEKNFISANKKAIYYDELGKEKEALYYYKKTLYLRPFKGVNNNIIIEKILNFNINIYGRYIGRKNTGIFIDNLLINIGNNKTSPIFIHLKAFCLDTGLRCYNIKN